MDERLIQGPGCLAEGCAWLARAEPRFGQIYDSIGLPPLRRRPEGFAPLVAAIAGQQVSVASADALVARLDDAGLLDESAVRAASDDDLRACGLSRQKIRYVSALAQARIDYDGLRAAPLDVVLAELTAVPGIGAWTAEIYAMFSLHRADVFAPGDMALQEAARLLFDLPDRPKERAFRQMATAWAPWRSVAARLLWAHYADVKSREGVA